MSNPRPAPNTRSHLEPASTTSTGASLPAAESDRSREGKASPSHLTICQRCGKRAYASERQAKRAHSKARFRLRLYECEHGAGWHVTHEQVDTRTRPEEMPSKGRRETEGSADV
jgi:ribosomal protein L37E